MINARLASSVLAAILVSPTPSGTAQKLTEQEVQGLWRITGAKLEADTISAGDLAGYVLFAPGHAAMELHMRGEALDDTEEFLFQSGIYEVRFDAAGRMDAFALIGADNFMDEDGLLLPEPPGRRHTFEVLLVGGTLSMKRPYSELTLERVGGQSVPGVEGRGERR